MKRMNERTIEGTGAPGERGAADRYATRLGATNSDFAFMKGLLIDIVDARSLEKTPMAILALDIARHARNAEDEDDLQKMVLGELADLPLERRAGKAQVAAVSRKIASRLWRSYASRGRGDPDLLADATATDPRLEARRDLLRIVAGEGGTVDTAGIIFQATLQSGNPVDAIWDFDFLVRHGFLEDQVGPWKRSGRMTVLTEKGRSALQTVDRRPGPA